MQNKEQTAVEFLEEKYRPKGYITAEEFAQAKEMEKEQEQIVNADLNATKRTAKGVNADVSIRRVKELAEQYYNKKYGGNK